ncbi:MAG TPA: hypothetical protein VHT53_03240 [Candidatus Elarobacter sp.]|jgi:hypothetical protein|nr:hypothetical protein [Candidatus Elarobacter sp.]
MLAGIALIAALPILAQSGPNPCADQATLVKAPPAALPRALSAKYPNGVEVSFRVMVDRAGTVAATRSDAADSAYNALTVLRDPALREFVATWAKGLVYSRAPAACTALVRAQMFSNFDFYPASSGVVGYPATVAGVDVGELSYAHGPGSCASPRMHRGEFSYPENETDASVSDTFGGRVGGSPVALVILRCEYNGHGFDANAHVLALDGGKARDLGAIGSGSIFSAESGSLPPFPGAWIHSSFAGGLLYADIWDPARRCANADWVSSTYTVRDGKLVLLNRLRHHRAGLPKVCSS